MTDVNIYDIGDNVTMAAAFTSNSVATDPTGVTFKIKLPSGAVTTYVYSTDVQLIKDSTGNSKESSITIILYLGIISSIKLPSRLVFPELLVPATRSVLLPSIRKLKSPAVNGLIILFWIKRGSVHGSSLCLLIA